MSLLKLRGEGGTNHLGRGRLVAIPNGEASVEQALVHKLAVAICDGLIHPLTIGNRPLPGTGNTA